MRAAAKTVSSMCRSIGTEKENGMDGGDGGVLPCCVGCDACGKRGSIRATGGLLTVTSDGRHDRTEKGLRTD